MKNLFVGLSEANMTTCTNYCYSQFGRSFFTGFNNMLDIYMYICMLFSVLRTFNYCLSTLIVYYMRIVKYFNVCIIILMSVLLHSVTIVCTHGHQHTRAMHTHSHTHTLTHTHTHTHSPLPRRPLNLLLVMMTVMVGIQQQRNRRN